MPKGITDKFHEFDYDIIYIPRCESLSFPVSMHPDMLFSVIGDGQLLTDRNYFLRNEAFFKSLEEIGVKIMLSERTLSANYPNDILFDAIKTENLLIGNLDFTAPELFLNNVKTVKVKQGYALCSTLLMENAAVSADTGICNALTENGYDVLKVSPGDIVLDGYNCGFIGGASAVLYDVKTVVFFGNIANHRDGEKITDFCKEHGYKVRYDKTLPLTDFGGVKLICVDTH